MSNGDVPPPIDLNSAAIAAVNLILSQLGISPLDILLGLFSGRDKFADTNNVINAYNQSAFWPLHALASDLQIAANNGAPISDSNPAIQTQFGVWKKGTATSIQATAGVQTGEGGPGFWTIFNLILKSWGASGDSETAVLWYVRALDAILLTLWQQAHPGQVWPGTGGGGGGGGQPGPTPGPLPDNCDSPNPDTDEISDLCHNVSFQLSEIYNQIINIGHVLPNPAGDPCCNAVVAAITKVAGELTVIAQALIHAGKNQQPVDLTALTAELTALVAAVNAYPPALQACCNAVTNQLGAIASAISKQQPADVTAIVDQLKLIAREGDVAQPIIDYLVQGGYLSGSDAQVLHGAPWGDAFFTMLRTYAWNAFQWALKQAGLVWNGTKIVLPALSAGITNDLDLAVSAALRAGAAPLYPVLKGLIDAVVGVLAPTALPTIGDVHVDPDLILSKTLAPILIINGVALLADYLGWEISEQLKEYVDLGSEFLGLQEVRELKVGQSMKFGPMREAEMRAKALYRQELPGAGTLAGFAARGLLAPSRAAGLLQVTGLPFEMETPTLEAAYRGLNPRQMLRLIETGLFSNAEIADELTFGGLRPVSQARMLHAAPYLATQPERRQLLGTLEKAYTAGLIDDPTLTGSIDSAEQNVDRHNLILTRVKYEVLIQEAKALETEYTTMFTGGLIDDPTYRSYLSGIGLQPWMVNLVAGKAEARANATLHKTQIRDAAALQRATAAEERKAAMKNFIDGNTNVAILTAALVATGLTATQALAWTDLAVLQKAGGLRWLFALQLSPSQALLLRQRVTALTDQRKRLQISDPQFVAALQALGIPPQNINALQAAADAMISPKKSAFAIPVSTA